MRLRQIVAEGGNIFKDAAGQATTQRINLADIKPTLSWLERVTKLPIKDNTIGSVGKKPTSGDLDVAVDAESISKDDLIAQLRKWIATQDGQEKDWIRKSGISVHLKTPIKGDAKNGYVQTDFMFYRNIPLAKWFAQYDPASAYKNADRIILMNSLAKSHGMKLSPDDGLVTREGNKAITTDPVDITKYLLGPDAGLDDMTSVERIISYVKAHDPDWAARTADARDNFVSRGLDIEVPPT